VKSVPLDYDLTTVALIARAKAGGATWRQIAPTIGCTTPKEARAKARAMARRAQREAIAQGLTRGEVADA